MMETSHSPCIALLKKVIVKKASLLRIDRMLLETLDTIAHGNDYESSQRAIDAIKEADRMNQN